jgi:hypothetical protein
MYLSALPPSLRLPLPTTQGCPSIVFRLLDEGHLNPPHQRGVLNCRWNYRQLTPIDRKTANKCCPLAISRKANCEFAICRPPLNCGWTINDGILRPVGGFDYRLFWAAAYLKPEFVSIFSVQESLAASLAVLTFCVEWVWLCTSVQVSHVFHSPRGASVCVRGGGGVSAEVWGNTERGFCFTL